MRRVLGCLVIVTISGLVVAKETDVPLDKLPTAITQSVKKKFPKAELIKAVLEEDEDDKDDEKEYEVTVKQDGKKIDVTLTSDGVIESYEKEIDLTDLPKAVTAAIDKKYPKSSVQSAEAVYEIEKGKEEFEFYELQIKTADKKELEIKIKADGTIIKESEDEDDKSDSKK